MFSHVDDQNRPGMVDVGAKTVTERVAHARSVVVLPAEAFAALNDGDIQTKKGPVFQTAILAGTMAVKKTSDLIPLCHPIPLDGCKFNIEARENNEVWVDCTARATHKTGVEMEALTGASVAALTIYDMCKAFSQNIVIRDTRLIEKRGGKSDYVRNEDA